MRTTSSGHRESGGPLGPTDAFQAVARDALLSPRTFGQLDLDAASRLFRWTTVRAAGRVGGGTKSQGADCR